MGSQDAIDQGRAIFRVTVSQLRVSQDKARRRERKTVLEMGRTRAKLFSKNRVVGSSWRPCWRLSCVEERQRSKESWEPESTFWEIAFELTLGEPYRNSGDLCLTKLSPRERAMPR
jgi:hypothetical protein